MTDGKILITGGAGFIGSEVVRQAIERGYKPIVVDSLSYAADLKRLKSIANQILFHEACITDSKKIESIFKKEKPSRVIHLAAETHVDRSILDGNPFIQTNVSGTMTLLAAAQRHGIKNFIHLSTDEVYGEIETGQFREDFPLDPNSPYSASKAAGDLLVKAFRRTYQFPAIIIRPSNNYGPWQYPEKFVPVIIYKALANEKIPVYAKGQNVREWLYVSDCAQAILTIMEKGKAGEVYNLGSGYEKKNIDVVHTILDILGKPARLIEYVEDRPGHDLRYSLNTDKLKKELRWQAETNFETGMKKTVDWYQENLKWLQAKAKVLQSYWKSVYKKKEKPVLVRAGAK